MRRKLSTKPATYFISFARRLPTTNNTPTINKIKINGNLTLSRLCSINKHRPNVFLIPTEYALGIVSRKVFGK